MGRHGKSEAQASSRLAWIVGAGVVAAAVAATSVWVIVRSGDEGTAAASVTDAADISVAGTSLSSAPPSVLAAGEPRVSELPTTAAPTSSAAPTCAELLPLRVATTAGLAPVLIEVAERECIDLAVTEVTAVGGAALLGAGEVDVWVPDSREYGSVVGEGAWAAPAVAWSPIVLAAEPTTAGQLAAAGSVPWGGLLVGQGKLGEIPAAVAPVSGGTSFAVGGALLAGAVAATGDQRTALAATAGALLGVQRVEEGQELSAIPAGSVRATELRNLGSAEVIPTTEGYPVLEAPWIAADPTGAAGPAMSRMLSGLADSDGVRTLLEHDLLAPGAAQVTVAEGVTGPALMMAEPTRTSLLWAMTGQGTRPGRTLAVLDVSGSMGDVQADGQTAMQGVKASAPLLFGAFTGETAVGLWIFGNQLNPPNDWSELVPIAPLSQSAQAIQEAVATIEPQRTGTSLNATVLAAYQNLQAGYDPNATNILGIFTDGRNEDAPGGIDLPTLQAQIAAIADPSRPIVLLCFGYGEADTEALGQMVAANGGLGGVWDIDQPEHIVGAMIEATAATLSFGS